MWCPLSAIVTGIVELSSPCRRRAAAGPGAASAPVAVDLLLWATGLTAVIRPPTVAPSGSSTVTRSPSTASLCTRREVDGHHQGVEVVCRMACAEPPPEDDPDPDPVDAPEPAVPPPLLDGLLVPLAPFVLPPFVPPPLAAVLGCLEPCSWALLAGRPDP